MELSWVNKTFSVERCDEVAKRYVDCDGNVTDNGYLLISRDGATFAIYPPNSWTAVMFG